MDFAQQLVLARMEAEIEEANRGFATGSMPASQDNQQCLWDELKQLAEEAGVHIRFTEDVSLSVQCARVRAEHELSLLSVKDSTLVRPVANKQVGGKPNNRVPLKVAVKNVQFGMGCC